jgi:phosphonatase-like hydrolase
MTTYALACLDMAGTTVGDDGLVERAFTIAMLRQGLQPRTPEFDAALDHVRATMGQSKIEVFRQLTHGDEAAAQRLNGTFEESYGDLVREGAVTPLPGAVRTLRWLREAGIRAALTTGFSKATQDGIVEALNWRALVDLLVCPHGTSDGPHATEEGAVVRGRPHPDMILFAAERCGVTDLGQVVVVGDTPSDMASGRAAAAGLVVGVLTGAGDRDALLSAGAHKVIDSVEDLPALL